MKILFVGDIFGGAGRRIVHAHLGHLLETHAVDLVVINAENSAGGFGVTPNIAEELFNLGAHVLTTGNHIWDKREIIDWMQSVPADSHEQPRRVLRPANYAPGTPGHGVYEGTLPRWDPVRGHQSAGARLYGCQRRSVSSCRCNP